MRKSLVVFIALLVVAALPAWAEFEQENFNPAEPTSATPAAPGTPVWEGAEALLHDNGPLVNSPGTGVGGADESVLQSVTLGMNTLGFGHQVSAGNRIADDFTVTDSAGWDVSTITFFAYQTGSPTTSTITAVNLQIWDGPPDAGGTVIWGDTATNVLATTIWSNIYRVSETTSGTSADRPIMANTVTVNTTLPAGTYWLDWQTDGTLSSGPWAPPITINGQATTGNAIQWTSSGGAWQQALDSGTVTQQGFPFVIDGEVVPVELQSISVE